MKKNDDLSDFSGKITSLEVYAQKGDLSQLRQVANEMYRMFHRELKKRDSLHERTKQMKKNMSLLKSKLKTTVDHFESSLITFEKFRTGIILVQQMRTFAELPDVLHKVKELLQPAALGLILMEEEYKDFVPDTIRLHPKELIRTEVGNLFSEDMEKHSFLGPVSELEDPGFFLGRNTTLDQDVLDKGSCFIFPLRSKYKPDQILGILSFFDADPKRYTSEKATDFLEHFCDVLSWSIVTVRDHEKLDRENIIDPLTKVHNRVYLYRHAPRILDFADRKQFPVCMLFIDLNGFKRINDTLGHEAGDRILIEAARCIRNIVRQYDIFVRLGGDEFVVVLPDTDPAKAEAFRERMKVELKAISVESCCDEPTDLSVSASVGMAMYKHGQSLDDFLKEADANMYEDKKQTAEKENRQHGD